MYGQKKGRRAARRNIAKEREVNSRERMESCNCF
jgi:hypothetical protein